MLKPRWMVSWCRSMTARHAAGIKLARVLAVEGSGSEGVLVHINGYVSPMLFSRHVVR